MGAPLARRIAERIHRLGPLPFAEYLELALYDPEAGFYGGAGGEAGRSGDFLTSPEVGPLFGTVVSRALDAWWRSLGEPDPFVVVEAGAGAGTLARDVLAAAPACAPALRYVLVERSERLRAAQAGRVPLEPPGSALGPVAPGAHGDERHPLAGRGPIVTSLGALPAERVTGVVLANELLDNLPPLLLERREGEWAEVRVGERDGAFVEVVVPAAPALAAEGDRLVRSPPGGARIPLQHTCREWLLAARAVLERGRVVVLDYADTTSSMAGRPWDEWLRTYRGHGRGRGPLEDPGGQDVTCEVAVDQLARVAAPAADRTQAEFLRAHGLDELAAAAWDEWRARAHVGDLAALRARSRAVEAGALADPAGLGAFRVLEWEVP